MLCCSFSALAEQALRELDPAVVLVVRHECREIEQTSAFAAVSTVIDKLFALIEERKEEQVPDILSSPASSASAASEKLTPPSSAVNESKPAPSAPASPSDDFDEQHVRKRISLRISALRPDLVPLISLLNPVLALDFPETTV